MIEGVQVIPLKVIRDDRGCIKHMIRGTDPYFRGFGEVYFSEILPGKVKAWRKSRKATRHYAAIEGRVKLVLYNGMQSEEHIIGENNHCLVIIPPGIWSGFMALGNKKAIVCDFMDIPYRQDEQEKQPPEAFLDCWKESR